MHKGSPAINYSMGMHACSIWGDLLVILEGKLWASTMGGSKFCLLLRQKLGQLEWHVRWVLLAGGLDSFVISDLIANKRNFQVNREVTKCANFLAKHAM